MAYAIPSLIIFPVILAFGNRPWGNSDYLFAAIGFISIIGLFIGLKWQGPGGLISAIFPLWVIIGQVSMSLKHKPEFGISFKIKRNRDSPEVELNLCYLLM